jgi:DNA-binding response OmpR family regulator
MKILIAETDFEVIEDVRVTFRRWQPDCQLSIINLGRQFLNIIKNGNSPDIVILGIRLSDMSGLEFARMIRDDSDIPIVFISKDEDVQVLVKAFESGANDYIIAPFNKEIFIARIKALLRRKNWDIQANEKNPDKVANNA